MRWEGCRRHAQGRREVYISRLCGILRENRPLGRTSSKWEDNIKIDVKERIILKWIFDRLGVGAQTGLIWLRIGTGGGLLCIR
jgi:hypothetical protein